jgi:histidine triad (HIT) family protein
MADQNCIFCKIIAGQLPATIVRQDDDLIVIQDIHPKAPIHYLIIPKKHIPDVQSIQPEDEHLMGKLFMEAQALAKTVPLAHDFNLALNNGAAAGQIVFHLHLHFLAGKKLFNL